MKKIILKVKGMTCSGCSSGLENYLKKQKGIVDASVNLVLATACVTYENIKVKDIETFIEKAGFHSDGQLKEIVTQPKENSQIKLIVFGFLLFILIIIGNIYNICYEHISVTLFSIIQFIFAIIFLLYGIDIIKSGFKSLYHKMPNMDTLVTISVMSSFLYSIYGLINILSGKANMIYFESTCMIIYFIKLGRYIENISKNKTIESIKKLVQITPNEAIVIKDNKEIKCSIDQVKVNDVLIARPTDKIAVDGIIISGSTHLDESFITGESKPVLKKINDKVSAGSINYDGVINYKALKIGKDSLISEIVKLVVKASGSKNKIQKIADKISGYFVPVLIIIAILTFVTYLIFQYSFQEALNVFITVLVVACPCALGLAVPLITVISNGICANKGILVKNNQVLEVGKDIDTVVLDKTGTITYGSLQIDKVYNYKKNKDLLKIVSSLEHYSTHPIASAFSNIEYYEVEKFKNIAGIGIQGIVNSKQYYVGNKKLLEKLAIKDNKNDYDLLVNSGCSILYVVLEKEIIGLIGIRDTIRENAYEFINQLKKNNIYCFMLTGDNEKTANNIAREVGIDEVIASSLPSEKVNKIKSLISSGKKVMMVGDGINDAPSLVSATVGVSMASSMDIASDAADVILINNDLSSIITFMKISKKSFKMMKQNLFWAFFYNLCMIPIAMGLFSKYGLKINPMMASIAMIISSLTVVLNSLRLRKFK